MRKIFVSVIIPVFNDTERLRTCLDAISKQTYPKSDFEIIVVDNGSTEDVQGIVDTYDNVKMLLETKPGSYCARNTGLASAKGDILAFTDADCIPDPKWIECGVDMLVQNPHAGLIAGHISLFFKQSQPNAVELYESIEMGFDQLALLEHQHYALTANLFTTRQVFERVGTFDEELKSGGDREWGQRVYQASLKQYYAPLASVGHPARYTFWQLYKRVTRINGGKIDASSSPTSLLDKFKLINHDLTLALTPPFRSVIKIFQNDEKGLKTYQNKLKFTFVMLFVRYISAWERIRLQLGGRSRRW